MLSPYVYSYIPGRSAKQAVYQCTEFLKKAYTAHKKLDMYVFRADIAAYSDSIPTTANAVFWSYLNTALDDLPRAETRSYIRSLIEEIVRPVMTNEEGLLFQNTVGIPTGSALTTLICNLYLRELDSALGSIPGAFYARYGDDFLFAHTDLQQFREGYQSISPILKQLNLKHNLEKEQLFYLTRAGKKDPHVAEFLGCNKIDFLGFIIFANGTISLKHSMIKTMLKKINLRIKNTAKILTHLSADERGPFLCKIINQLLDPASPLVDPTIKRLLTLTNNRDMLKQIDYAIALTIAELLSNKKKVRAFQVIPYATIRSNWGLISLCQQRGKISFPYS